MTAALNRNGALFPIRAATPDDAVAISALILPLAEKFITCEFSIEGRRALLESLTPEILRERILGRYCYFIAEQGDEAAGVIAIREAVHVFHLFVAEEFHRHGVGRALWEFVRDEALRSGNPGRFTVNSSRYAIPFYERLGFVAADEMQTVSDIQSYPMVWETSALRGCSELNNLE
jgi:GNAT superfamily N-acetyltransferase